MNVLGSLGIQALLAKRDAARGQEEMELSARTARNWKCGVSICPRATVFDTSGIILPPREAIEMHCSCCVIDGVH